MQSVSSRIRTRVAVSISYDDNHYTTGTSKREILMGSRTFSDGRKRITNRIALRQMGGEVG